MITLMDIQKAISRKLDSKFTTHYIYVEEVKEGLKRPSFFINIMPVSTDNFITYKEKLANIDIMYFSKNETNNENLEMINLLESLFNTPLKIQDREITIRSLNFKVIDNILHCNFSLDFNNSNLVEIKTKVGFAYLPEHEISEELGYTKDNIEVMQELESEVD